MTDAWETAEVRLLGVLEVLAEGVPVELRATKVRAVLAMLALHPGQVVSAERLAQGLWADAPPPSAANTLQGYVSQLRRALGRETIVTRAPGYLLAVPPEAVDASRFERIVVEGRAAVAGGRAEDAAVLLERGLALWRGSALDEFAYEPFAQAEATRLEELRLVATEEVVEAKLALGRHAELVGELRRLVEDHPLRERLWGQLMRALYGCGRQAEALRAFSELRRRLGEELGIEPSAALQRLEEAMLVQNPELEWHKAPSQPPAAASPSASTEAAYLHVLAGNPVASRTWTVALPLPLALAALPESFVVGRDAEVERLSSAFKRAAVEGRRCMLVAGEPGVGKTTLVAEFARAAHAHGARVLYGRCDDEMGVAYQPFAEALSDYVATCPLAELRAHVAAWEGEAARLVPGLVRRLPEVSAPSATEAHADRWRLFEAVDDLLERVAVAAPVVLVLDDLHWASDPTLLLLRHLVTRPRPGPVLVVGTYRQTDAPPASSLAATLSDLRRSPAVDRLELEGLGLDGVAAFAAAAGVDDAALARKLWTHTAGNPFFVGELLRHLSEVRSGHGAGPSEADLNVLVVPQSVGEVVSRRVRRLSPEANEVLLWAAIVGTEFGIDVLEAVCEAEPGAVLDGVEEALAARLVLEDANGGGYRFAHALVRHAIYGGLSATRRARLHRRVAEAVESLPGDDSTRVAALAHHFAEAATAGAGDKAADYAVAAAKEALGRGVREDAFAILGRGLQALNVRHSDDFARRADLLLEASRAHAYTGSARGAQAMALQAADHARRADSGERLAQAACLYATDAPQGSQELLEEALGALGEGCPAVKARVLAALATIRQPIDHVSERLSEEALALARACGDREALGTVVHARWLVLLGTPNARELLARAEELATSGCPEGWLGWSQGLYARAIARLVNADRGGFDRDVEELERRERRLGTWGYRYDAARLRTARALLDGRFDDVELLAGRAREVAAEQDFVADVSLPVAIAWWERGWLAEERAAVLAKDVDKHPQRLVPRALLALARLSQGDRTVAEHDLTQLAGMLEEVQRAERSLLVAVLAELATDLGAIAVCTDLFEVLRPNAGQMIVGTDGSCPGSVDAVLGLLATTMGRWSDAEAHFLEASSREARLRSPPVSARTNYWWARMLANRPDGDHQRARALAESAKATAQSVMMSRLASEADALLHRSSLSRPEKMAGGARERRRGAPS